jgi:hypothetical protein
MKKQNTLYIDILNWANGRQEKGFTWGDLKNEFNLTEEQLQWVQKIFRSNMPAGENLIDHLSYNSETNAHSYVITAKGTSAAVQIEEIFALKKLTEEVQSLKQNLANYSVASENESKIMRYLTYVLGAVALFQLIIAYWQYRLADVQTDMSRDQTGLERAVWEYDKTRDDRLEARDVEWRRQDLQFQGRLP